MVCVDGVTFVDASRHKRVGKSPCCCGHANPDNRSAKETTEHHLTTANLLNKMSAEDSERELEHTIAKSDVGLANGVVDTCGVEHSCQEVR